MMKLIPSVVIVLSSIAVTSATPNIPEAKVKPGFKPKNGAKNLGLCESDCDKDSDCLPGLICADGHEEELEKIGLDKRAANCYSVVKPWNYEVCFDPKILSSGGAGGDPHFRTYDGTRYTYHGECDLVMAHSQLDEENVMDLHARTQIVDKSWSLISNAAIRIGDDVFEVDNDQFSYYFNGVKDVAFPILLAGKYTVTSEEREVPNTTDAGEETTTKEMVYTIDLLKRGSIVITNYRTMLSIRVDSYLQDTYGMLGHRTKDGLIGRDGALVASENEMGANWQVRDTEPMLFHEIGAGPQYPESCILPTTTSRRLRATSTTVDAANKACETVDATMKAFCVEDVLRTDDVTVAHVYQASAW